MSIKQTKKMIERAYFSKRVEMDDSKETKVGFCLAITECPISDEQMGELLNILDDAAQKAAAVMKW